MTSAINNALPLAMLRSSPKRPQRSTWHNGLAATEPPMTIATANALHDIGIARQIGTYGDAVEVPAHARWLFTAGTPGLAGDGTLPADITAQAELAWQHIDHMLRKAGMGINDIVKLTQCLVSAADIPAYAAVRAR